MTAPFWAMRNSTLRCFQACPIALFFSRYFFRPSQRDLYAAPKTMSHSCDLNTFGWFVMREPLECARTTRIILGLALPSVFFWLGSTSRADGYHSTFLSCISCGKCCACAQGLAGPIHEGKEVRWMSFLGGGPSFVSLGLLVTFACRSGLNNRSGVCSKEQKQIQRRASTKNKIQNINTETRAHKYKYKKKKQLQQTIQTQTHPKKKRAKVGVTRQDDVRAVQTVPHART